MWNESLMQIASLSVIRRGRAVSSMWHNDMLRVTNQNGDVFVAPTSAYAFLSEAVQSGDVVLVKTTVCIRNNAWTWLEPAQD